MNRFLLFHSLAIGLGLSLASTPVATAASAAAKPIQTIRAIGTGGSGNAAASPAWRELSAGGAGTLVELLTAMDGASPLALNWLRAAVDSIASRELAAGGKLPLGDLEKFLARTSHHPRARRLAYELIAQADARRAESLIRTMLNDPSTELRRDAVERVVSEARQLREAKKEAEAIARYQAAIQAARDVDQVEAVAKALKDLGRPVQLAQVFGWVTDWKVIGPFDSAGGAGFEKVYPPEEKVNLQAELDGKDGKVRWQPLLATNDYGLVDLNKPLGSLKGVAGYAFTEIQSDQARTVELRLGCKNAWKIWLNGQLLFGRDEYHRGMEIDQYRLKAALKAGRNELLVKVCQNEQTEEWTKEWEFQLRITDDLGTPVIFAKR